MNKCTSSVFSEHTDQGFSKHMQIYIDKITFSFDFSFKCSASWLSLLLLCVAVSHVISCDRCLPSLSSLIIFWSLSVLSWDMALMTPRRGHHSDDSDPSLSAASSTWDGGTGGYPDWVLSRVQKFDCLWSLVRLFRNSMKLGNPSIFNKIVQKIDNRWRFFICEVVLSKQLFNLVFKFI